MRLPAQKAVSALLANEQHGATYGGNARSLNRLLAYCQRETRWRCPLSQRMEQASWGGSYEPRANRFGRQVAVGRATLQVQGTRDVKYIRPLNSKHCPLLCFLPGLHEGGENAPTGHGFPDHVVRLWIELDRFGAAAAVAWEALRQESGANYEDILKIEVRAGQNRTVAAVIIRDAEEIIPRLQGKSYQKHALVIV